MENKSLRKNIIIWSILGAIILALPASTVVKSALKKLRIENMLETRETVAEKVGKYIQKDITGYNDISGVKVTTDYSITELKKKDYDEWNDVIIVTCTPKKGFSKLSNYEKKQYMVAISEQVSRSYPKNAKQVSEDYYEDILEDTGWNTMEIYACRQETYVDVYCVTSKHTYYYNGHSGMGSFHLDSGSNFYVDGKEKSASAPQKSSSSKSTSSKSTSSSSSSSKKSSGSSSRKTYNSYSYDPADYDDPDEFAEDAEDEYGSYDAAYDAWENY